jgi:hypothetical protein
MSSSLLGISNVDSNASIEQIIQAASGNPQPATSGPSGFRKVLGGLVGAAANVFAPGLGSVIGNVIGGGSGGGVGGFGGNQMSPTAMLQVQQQMAFEQEAFTLASNVLKDRHDAAMSAIQNSKSS